MPDDHRRAAALWIAAAILLLGFGLRIHRLAYDSIWWDEGYSIWMARMPIREMLVATSFDTHPPLSYALLYGWRALVGEEEFALRVLTVFFGLLTVAVGYQTGREVGGRSAGLAGALLIAAARLPVWWSQEVRMYALAAFFSALALWMALRLFHRRGRQWTAAVGLALSLAAGLLTLYLFAGTVLALNLAFIAAFCFDRKRWKLAVNWIGAQVGALAIFLPWAIYAYGHLPSWATPQPPVDLWHVVKLYLGTIFLGIATGIERYAVLLTSGVAALVGAGVVSLIAAGKQKRGAWVTLVIGTLLPPLLVYLLSLPRGQFNYPVPSPRYFLLLSTPVYVLIGWGAAAANRCLKHAGTVVLLGVVGIGLWSLGLYYPGLYLADDYLSMAAVLEAMRQPDDAVVLNNDADWPIFDYHYPHPYDRHISKTQPIRDEKYAEYLLAEYQYSHSGVWLVQTQYASVTDPDDRLYAWLRSKSWGKRHYVFPTGELWFFSLTQERGDRNLIGAAVGWPDSFERVEAPISEGVSLAGYYQPVPEIRAGERLVIGLGWHTGPDVTGEWPIALSLVGANGEVIASTTRELTTDRYAEVDRYEPVELFVPLDALGGRAQIVFAAGETWQPLGSIVVRERRGPQPGAVVIPEEAAEIGARFGQGIRLVAAELPDQAIWHPGEQVPVTLYWQAEEPIAGQYKVFVHLVGDTYNPATNNSLWGQWDQEPQGGAAPTSGWEPGVIIEDGYLIPVDSDAPPGHYRLVVGLYSPVEGGRLSVFDRDGQGLGDAVLLLEVEIER